MEEQEQITIVGPLSGASRGRSRDIVERTLSVTDVREQFAKFLDGLRAIVDIEVPAVGDYELDEIQFSAEISAEGEFKLLGSGVGIGASSGVTFTLKRRSNKS